MQGIVKNHGGFINVYCEVGRGTEFKIYLPVAEPPHAISEAIQTDWRMGSGELILVVDDEAAVLLDINLPDSSGLDLLREIKRRSPQAAVIMITAETLFENAVAALGGGADDFIGKPINLEELRFALDHTLKLKQQGRAPPPNLDRRARAGEGTPMNMVPL